MRDTAKKKTIRDCYVVDFLVENHSKLKKAKKKTYETKKKLFGNLKSVKLGI